MTIALCINYYHAVCRRDRQISPITAIYLALPDARMAGPTPAIGVDPRSHHGDCRCLHDSSFEHIV